MSRLVPGLIPLNTGLNLQTPKITAPQGSVLDSLNYEQVDFQGQKRIDGYTRYDGQRIADVDLFAIITFDGGEGVSNDLLVAGVRVFFSPNDKLAGIITSTYVDLSDNTAYVTLARIDHTVSLKAGDNVRLVAPDEGEFADPDVSRVFTSEEYARYMDSAEPEKFQYEHAVVNNDVLRALVSQLPGPIAGLHWFDNSLYAIAPIFAVTLTDVGILPNVGYIVGLGYGGEELQAVVLGVDDNIIYLLPDDYSQWTLSDRTDIELYHNEDYIGLITGYSFAASSTEPNVDDTLDWGYTSNTLYRAMTEQQVIAVNEDYSVAGWKAIHLGWKVPFDNGISLYGSLPSLDQNIQGLGVQGPTSISGNTGRPLTLSQGRPISGEKAQVNGWKSSQTPTNFTLNPADVWDTDSNYTYADAFISWNGTTGAVSAPGVTTNTIPQYSATNTVDVVIS